MTRTHGGSGSSGTSPRLVRRLGTLRTLEWLNVGLLAFALLWLLPSARGVGIPAETWQRMLAYLPIAALLVAGGWYWHGKQQQLRHGRDMDDALAFLDRFDRTLCWLLTASAGLVITSWVARIGVPADRSWATGFVMFAWLEYVNYFRVQLMHDTRSDLRRLWHTQRLRRSRLATDLQAWRAARRNTEALRLSNRPPPPDHT